DPDGERRQRVRCDADIALTRADDWPRRVGHRLRRRWNRQSLATRAHDDRATLPSHRFPPHAVAAFGPVGSEREPAEGHRHKTGCPFVDRTSSAMSARTRTLWPRLNRFKEGSRRTSFRPERTILSTQPTRCTCLEVRT